MEEKKQKVYWFVPIIILAVILVAYFYEWDLGAKNNPEVTAYNVIDLAEIVNSQIDSGKDKGSFYISGITEEELTQINDYVCSVNGMVDRYVINTKSGKKQKITFHYEISDNYYVKEKYLNGVEIPSDRPMAYKLYEKTVEIIDSIIKPGMTDYEKELAIHDYIVANCKYGQKDESKEYGFRAYGCLVQGIAVCNGYAEAMSLLLTCAGVENGIMTGSAGEELHAWNIVKIDGQWYQVDATWDDPVPDTGDFVSHTFFNITDDMMDDTHSWNEELYEQCKGKTYNYYDYNGYVYEYSDLEKVVTDAAMRDITGELEFVVTDYDESLYTYDFINNIPGINSISHVVQPMGNNHVIIIYLN
ncbi:MAG: hypothetical protein E7263_05345 [Lachnospiraceae bacterium]|nr:hypothetical protein [Lachnospiraceae bacterium]